MPRSATIPPFSIPGGLAGLARGLDSWPSMEQRAADVVGLMTAAPRQRTRPAVLLVQLLAYVTVHQGKAPEPASGPPALLRALAAVLGVEKHATRAAVMAGPLTDAEAAERLGVHVRTVRRQRARPTTPSGESAEAIADRWAAWRGRGQPPGAAMALYDLAAAEVAAGAYFSTPLLSALAEVLGVARQASGLTQAATEVLHKGLRDPEKFIAAGVADGRAALERAGEDGAHRMLAAAGLSGLDLDAPEPKRASRHSLATAADVDRTTVKRWQAGDSPHSTAYELNRLNAAAFARFNTPVKGRK